MRRPVLKIICIASGVLFAIISVCIVAAAVLVLQTVGNTGSTGIIGGAGAPTLLFLLRSAVGAAAYYIALFSLLLFVGTGLALFFSKKSKQ